MNKKRIAIFASGNGTNAEKIFEYFQNHPAIEVALLLSNKKEAGVLERAGKFDIPTWVCARHEFYDTDFIIGKLLEEKIDFIVLAGFLWLVPSGLVAVYPQKIVNIHPALLPKYGGKGMYGMKVHQAVKNAGEKESGISIHYVNENYDEGDIITQKTCQLTPNDTPEDIARKVRKLEHEFYPKVIAEVVLK